MKMRENSGKKLKGSVLFTVIAVMMVVLVFVMSALTIAGATSRRAYSDYAKKQTQYTARTAIEATIEYLNENDDFKKMVEGMGKGATKDVTIDFPDAAKGIGDIDVQIKCEGKNADTGEDIVTITATSEMLDDETSIVAYISKKAPVPKSGGFNRAMTSMGGASISNHTSVFGGTSVNVLPSVDDYEASGGVPETGDLTKIQNEGALQGKTFVNGDAYIANKSEFIFDNFGDSLVVYGSYWEQNGAKFTSNIDKSTMTSYTQVPYIFVRDTMFWMAGGDAQIGSPDKNINIYAGNIISTTKLRDVYGDIYTFGTHSGYTTSMPIDYFEHYEEVYDEEVEVNLGDGFETAIGAMNVFKSDGTSLTNWAGSLINGVESKNYCGGSFYSAGSLNCQSALNISKNAYIQQGAYVTKGLKIGSTIPDVAEGGTPTAPIDGIFYVGGALHVGGTDAFTANKLIVSNTGLIKFVDDNPAFSFKLWNGMTYKTYNKDNLAELDANPYYIPTDSYPGDVWNYPTVLTYPNIADSSIGGFVTSQKSAINDYYGELADGSGDKGYYSMEVAPAIVNNIVYEYGGEGSKHYFPHKGYKEYVKKWIKGSPIPEYIPLEDGGDFVITENCTIKGTFKKHKIVVNPSAGSDVLWIKCDELWTESDIVVDDSARDGDGIPSTKVKFYTDTYIYLNNGAKILTKTYESLLGKDIDIKQSPTAGNFDETKYIPNIYVFCDGEGTQWDDQILNIQNNSMITGYIFAPEGTINNNTTYGGFNSIKYEGSDVNSYYKQTMAIGAVVCGNILADNNASIFYINPNGNKVGDDFDTPGSYKILYYNNG